MVARVKNPAKWVVVDVDVGEHAKHPPYNLGVRRLAVDRLCAPWDVRDHLWVVCRLHSCEVAGVEGVVALLHEREEVCRPAGVLGRGSHEGFFSRS